MKVKAITFLIMLFSMIVLSSCDPNKTTDDVPENPTPTEIVFSFSHESGLYPQSFVLEISAPGDEIYYSLDGSVPDKNATEYENGIPISNSVEYLNASNTDISGGYHCIEESEGQEASNYRTQFDIVDTATVVRAIYYDEEGSPSDVITGYYKIIEGGSNPVSTVSIVTEPASLFDYED